MLSYLVQGVLVFVAAMLIDVFYALWFRFSNKGWEHKAAAMSVLCGAAGLFGSWMIISEGGSEWFIVPDLAGLYLGTIVGLRFSKWLEERWSRLALPEVKTLTLQEVAKLRQMVAEYNTHQQEDLCSSK